MSELKDKVEKYVKDYLKEYTPIKIRAPKVIHDPILGSNLFSAHEIAVLDLPLIQRLRRISQVDLASLVFPSANHNRFEHTLGVAVLAGKFVNSLRKSGGDNKLIREQLEKIGWDFIYNHVRMAAIMHDCGHGPFSHMSEQIYENFTDIKNIKPSNKKFAEGKAKAHEILSYFIVTSNAFKDFFSSEIASKYNVKNIDLELVGNMIIGYVDDPKLAFMTNIINGAFDADKLDYIQRDGFRSR
ncbi:MAG: HD domain-containing protein [Thermacetogeniaceae bacterium]|jgi:HD superfamily phosphohydrolase|nr:HD domain-containing protein [Thermoanaerobacterales bacterium]